MAGRHHSRIIEFTRYQAFSFHIDQVLFVDRSVQDAVNFRRRALEKHNASNCVEAESLCGEAQLPTVEQLEEVADRFNNFFEHELDNAPFSEVRAMCVRMVVYHDSVFVPMRRQIEQVWQRHLDEDI